MCAEIPGTLTLDKGKCKLKRCVNKKNSILELSLNFYYYGTLGGILQHSLNKKSRYLTRIIAGTFDGNSCLQI